MKYKVSMIVVPILAGVVWLFYRLYGDTINVFGPNQNIILGIVVLTSGITFTVCEYVVTSKEDWIKMPKSFRYRYLTMGAIIGSVFISLNPIYGFVGEYAPDLLAMYKVLDVLKWVAALVGVGLYISGISILIKYLQQRRGSATSSCN